MNIEKYTRKTFAVDAVRVTEDNLHEVAKWCQGEVRTSDDNRKHIAVRVLRPLNSRQTMAFVGDWVLYAGTGYKVYTNGAFTKSFDSVFQPVIPGLEEAASDIPQISFG